MRVVDVCLSVLGDVSKDSLVLSVGTAVTDVTNGMCADHILNGVNGGKGTQYLPLSGILITSTSYMYLKVTIFAGTFFGLNHVFLCVNCMQKLFSGTFSAILAQITS